MDKSFKKNSFSFISFNKFLLANKKRVFQMKTKYKKEGSKIPIEMYKKPNEIDLNIQWVKKPSDNEISQKETIYPNNNHFNIDNLSKSLIENSIEAPIENVKISEVKKENIQEKYKFLNHLKRIFNRLFKKSPNLVEPQILPRSKSTKNTRKFTHFIIIILLVLKAIRAFKWRTEKLRKLNFVNERQISIINDASHINNPHSNKTKFIFIKNKFIRMKILAFKKKFKQFYVLLKKIYQIISKTSVYIPVIRPDKKIKIIWDLIIIFIISVYFYLIPMQLCFDMFYDDELEILFETYHLNKGLVEFIIILPELMLIIDTLLKFITGFYENGVIVEEKATIVHHYIRKGLVFDCLTYIPVLMQGIFRKKFPWIGLIVKELQLLMFFKIKRVKIAISNYEEIIASNGKHDFLLSFFKLMYVILFITHVNACIWHALAYFHPDINAITWLDYSGLKTSNWVVRYLYSFYWAISMMATIGFGEKISPRNNLECVGGMLILIISVLLFGYCINSMKQILDMMSKEENEYKETVRIINSYMRSHNVSFELQSRVRKYLEYTLKNEVTHSDGENNILNKLNTSLKKELLIESLGKIIKAVPFFKNNFSDNSIEQLVFRLKKMQLTPEEFLYRENVFDDRSLYVLLKGNLEEVSNFKSSGPYHSLKKIKAGDIVGWHSFITDQKRYNSIVSKDFSTVYEIKKDDFIQIIKTNSHDYEKFCMIKDQIKIYEDFDEMKYTCNICFKKTHFSHHCGKIQYIPDKDFLIKRFNYSGFQPRSINPYSRTSKKKFHAVLSLTMIQLAAVKFYKIIEEDLSISECSISEENESPQNFFRKQEKLKTKLDFSNFNMLLQKKPSEYSKLDEFSPQRLLKKNSENNKNDDFKFLKKPGSEDFIPKTEEQIDFEIPIETEKEKGMRDSKEYLKPAIKLKTVPEISFTPINLFEYDFEIAKNFSYYFPKNNVKRVIEMINMHRTDKKKRHIKNKEPNRFSKFSKMKKKS